MDDQIKHGYLRLKDSASRAAGIQLWTVVSVVAAALMAIWAFAVYRAAYDVRDAAGLAVIARDRLFYGAIVTELPRNLTSLFPDTALLFAAIGPGRLILDRLRLRCLDCFERYFLSMILGLCFYTFAILGVGWLQILRAQVLASMLAVGALTTVFLLVTDTQLRDFVRVQQQRISPLAGFQMTWIRIAGAVITCTLIFYLYIALLGALAPETQFDSRIYHLGVANHLAQRGGLYDIVHDTGLARAGWPAYQQLLYAGLIPLSGVIAAKLLHWLDAVLTVVFLIYFCRAHFDNLFLGLVAALIFVATPIVTWSSGTGANDLTMALLTLVILHTFLRWKSDPTQMHWLLLTGALSGYSVGVKWTGLSVTPVCGFLAVTLLIMSGRRLNLPNRTIVSSVILASVYFTGSLLIFILPSLIHGYALTGNPTFPLLYTIFHSPYWNARVDAVQHGSFLVFGYQYSLAGFLALPWALVSESGRNETVIGPLYLISLPTVVGAVAFSRERSGRLLRFIALFIALWLVVWFASGAIDARYLETIFPALSVLVAYVLVAWKSEFRVVHVVRWALWIVVIPMIVLGNQLLVPLHTSANSPGVEARENIPWEYLYRGQSEYYVQMVSVPMLTYVNRHLSACHDKVYDGADLMLFYLYSDPELFNGSQYDGPVGLGQWTLSDPDALRRLARTGATHVVIYTQRIAMMNPTVRAHLVQQHVDTASGETLFRVEYPRGITPNTFTGCP